MKIKNWLVPLLIVVGLGLITLSLWQPKAQFGFSNANNEVAFMAEKSGKISLRNNEMPESIQVKLNTPLKLKDILRTEENSEASIQWLNESQFRILEKSEVLIDQLDNGQNLVVVRSGDIEIEKFGKETSFWVRKEGQLLSAVDFAISDKSKLTHLKEPLPTQNNQSQLSQSEIETILNTKKTDFFKCYGQVLQKNTQAHGSVLISFSILNHGHTSRIEIAKSEIDDNNFKSCLMEVVARTQFKSFAGTPITTVFPLKFD